jgi:hypothetical protein
LRDLHPLQAAPCQHAPILTWAQEVGALGDAQRWLQTTPVLAGEQREGAYIGLVERA